MTREIYDSGLQAFRALAPGEPVDGDLIRDTLESGAMVEKTYFAPEAIDIAEVFRRKNQALYTFAKQILDEKDNWYSEGEQYAWEELEKEIGDYLIDNNNKGRHITARETAGITPTKQITDAAVGASALVTLVAQVIANRTVHKTAMEVLRDTPDLEGLVDYDFTTGWPDVE